MRSAAPPRVSVVTPTKARPGQLLRAIESVRAQCGVEVEHIVIGDDCPFLGDASNVRALEARFERVTIRNVTNGAAPGEYLPARLARLRNTGIALANGDFIAHLDDDNAYRPNHLARLVRALRRSPAAEVAYSWRRLFTADGTPFVPRDEDPWFPFALGRRRSYRRLSAAGVFVKGSPIVRDTLCAGPDGRLIARVDTSELLCTRALHARIPFPTDFSPYQRLLEATDDVRFGLELMRERVGVVCTRKATLDYYLGGYSNGAAPEADRDP